MAQQSFWALHCALPICTCIQFAHSNHLISLTMPANSAEAIMCEAHWLATSQSKSNDLHHPIFNTWVPDFVFSCFSLHCYNLKLQIASEIFNKNLCNSKSAPMTKNEAESRIFKQSCVPAEPHVSWQHDHFQRVWSLTA